MANEFKHVSVGTALTQTEFEAIDSHVLNSQETDDTIRAASATSLARIKNAFSQNTAPGASDDSATGGYSVGSMWIDTTGDTVWINVDVSAGAAIWVAIAGITDPGSIPAGELGGTWASPTVDATHSGSSHAALPASATATNMVLTTPNLGTPSALVLTNATGLPAAAVLAGSLGTGAYVMDSSLQVVTTELGHATDTTLSRVSAGLIAVEGITVVDVSTSQTLTNKTLTTPTITNPGGLDSNDVGLANVDNTSNATERAAVATLTNKTLTSPSMTSPTVSSGALVLTSGAINFPATQVPSADANALDDYEEGTFTPVLAFATPGDSTITHSTQAGTYTKIGRVVIVLGTVATSTFTHTTASGVLRMQSLPFTSASGVANVGTLMGGEFNNGDTYYTTRTPASTSYIEFLGSAGAGSGGNNILTAPTHTSGDNVEMQFTMIYTI